MDTRARDHPGIILDWERGDMVLYPIAAGLDTTLTRASQELSTSDHEYRTRSIMLESSPFRKSKSSSYLCVDRKRSTLRHSFSLGIGRFSFSLHISSCQYTQDFGIAIKRFRKILASHSRSASTFAFCIIVISFARRPPTNPHTQLGRPTRD
jgi:hypothetical protein